MTVDVLTGPALVGVESFADYLGVEEAELNSARAELLLRQASDLVRAYTRQRIDFVADETIDLIGPGGNVLLLPEVPVVEVGEIVEFRLGLDDMVLVVSDDYRLELGHDGRRGIIRRVGSLWRHWPTGDAVRVTYSHGYAIEGSETGTGAPTLPASIEAAVLRCVTRGYTNPAGKRQETIGRYSYTAGGSDAGLYLTGGDLEDLKVFRAGGPGGST